MAEKLRELVQLRGAEAQAQGRLPPAAPPVRGPLALDRRIREIQVSTRASARTHTH